MRIGTPFGLWVRIGPSLFLLLVIFAAARRLLEGLTLFAAVFVHELAHVAAARRFGVSAEGVELSALGGVAQIDASLAWDPRAERWVAVAGPLSNLVMACGGWAAAAVFGGPGWNFFVQANVILGGFNLLPALPLDGGRVLRAALAARLGHRRAARLAVRISRGVAVLMFVAGAVGLLLARLSVNMAVLACFVYVNAARERSLAAFSFVRFLLAKREELQRCRTLPVAAWAATPDVPVGEVADRFVPQRFHVVWVVGGSAVEGVLTERDIIRAWMELGPDTPLGTALARRRR